MCKNAFKIVLFILWLLPTISYTQVFPVQVSPQIIPPYGVKLSDYSTSSQEKIILNLLLSDINELNRQIGIKIYLENNSGISVQSSSTAITTLLPFHIDGGIPLRLSNLDFKENFELQNLQGITPQQYAESLPDGFYQFCFEVFDWYSKQPISSKSCVSAYIVKNAPPLLNLPFKGDLVAQKTPQNVIFQWTPRHINANNVQYEFTLVELWDSNMDPQAAFLSGRPLYQELTTSTTFLYGPGETALLPNKTYAWRVRAIIGNGIGEPSPFENNGFSEIFHFMYSGACAEPQMILAQTEGSNSERITWQGVEHRKYKVQYRKKIPNAEWFDINTENEYATIYNLEKGLPYEFRVGGQCINNPGFVYSQVYEFFVPIGIAGDKGYNCGITPEIEITTREPLEQLGINEVFVAGDFPVTVKEVYNNNGRFRGWGYIIVPYLGDTKIKVSFDGIAINKDYQLMEGVVITDYDKDWSSVDDISDEINALGELFGGALDILESAINTLNEGNLTGADLEALIDALEDDLTSGIISKLQEIKEQITELEEALENAETPEEKAEIQNQIDALNQEVEDILETIKDKIVDIVVKAFNEYYKENKSQEEILVSQYYRIHNSQNNIISNNVSAVNEDGSSDSGSGLDFEIEMEGEIIIPLISKEIQMNFDTEEKFHLYFFSKSIAESDDNTLIVKSFIRKSLEEDIDIVNLIKKSQDNGDSDSKIADAMVSAIENALKQIINKHKYKYLEQ